MTVFTIKLWHLLNSWDISNDIEFGYDLPWLLFNKTLPHEYYHTSNDMPVYVRWNVVCLPLYNAIYINVHCDTQECDRFNYSYLATCKNNIDVSELNGR